MSLPFFEIQPTWPHRAAHRGVGAGGYASNFFNFGPHGVGCWGGQVIYIPLPLCRSPWHDSAPRPPTDPPPPPGSRVWPSASRTGSGWQPGGEALPPPLGAALPSAGRGGPPNFPLRCAALSSLLAPLKIVQSYLLTTTKPCGKQAMVSKLYHSVQVCSVFAASTIR